MAPPDVSPQKTTAIKTYTVSIKSPSSVLPWSLTSVAASCRLSSDRPDEYRIHLPPEHGYTLPQIALAIAKQYPTIQSSVQPFLRPAEPKSKSRQRQVPAIHIRALPGADLREMVVEGLTLPGMTAQVSVLYHTLRANSDRVEVTFNGLMDSPDMMDQLASSMGEEFIIINIQKGVYEGTKIFSGEATALVRCLTKKVPSSKYEQHFDGWSCPIECTIRTQITFCHFCRSRDHIRNDCPSAPACKKCQSLTHSTQRCDKQATTKAKPVPSKAGLPTPGQTNPIPLRSSRSLKRIRSEDPTSNASTSSSTPISEATSLSTVPSSVVSTAQQAMDVG